MAIKEKIQKIELFLNECYPCHQKKYVQLYDWIISSGIPLRDFSTNRIVLDRRWLEYARKIKKENGIEPPFIVVQTDKGKYIYEYESFLKEGTKVFSKKDQDEIRNNIMTKKIDVVAEAKEKRKTKTKKAKVEKSETLSTDIGE